ncbi:MAG: citramalate synthase [Rhodobacteraceae bacterium]|nr:citramalate synthase [Paracoccaceae bacterium]
MAKERLTLYDTTMRDGQQMMGVQFSGDDKYLLTEALDRLGIDYIEAGWPGANPTDSGFFESRPQCRDARVVAFGRTKMSGRSAANDGVLAELVNAGADALCLFGKTHDFHVEKILGVTLSENIDNIGQSIAHLSGRGIEAVFDAEHFFDGYKSNPDYAVECLLAARENGARWIVLCDTNGGTLPGEIGEITAEVIRKGVPGANLGIHTHNDTGNAVAASLAAVDAGARQIQGTLNGLGERCGNADLVSLIPTLLLKEPYKSCLDTGVSERGLKSLTEISRLLDDILNRVPAKSAPYVGASAFTHKAGVHASAVAKFASSYEHIDPETVGNRTYIPMSNQAGRSNLVKRLKEAGIVIDQKDQRIGDILREIKRREDEGYSFDIAQASFELLARRMLGLMPEYFSVVKYAVNIEHVEVEGRMRTASRAEVELRVAGEIRRSSADAAVNGKDDKGPVHALARAVSGDLGIYQSFIEDMRLVDYKVRITSGGTEAVTRVVIDYEDRQHRRWSTVGVSPNILDASFQAHIDAVRWKLVRDQAPV